MSFQAILIGGPRHGEVIECPTGRPHTIEVSRTVPIRLYSMFDIETPFLTDKYNLSKHPILTQIPYVVYEHEDLDLDTPTHRAERLEREIVSAEQDFSQIKPRHDDLADRIATLRTQRNEVLEQHGI